MSIYEVAETVAAEYLKSYGKEIPIITPEAEEPQSAGPVIYSIDKLKQTGFSLVDNMAHEIRETFKICEQLPPRASETLR